MKILVTETFLPNRKALWVIEVVSAQAEVILGLIPTMQALAFVPTAKAGI